MDFEDFEASDFAYNWNQDIEFPNRPLNRRSLAMWDIISNELNKGMKLHAICSEYKLGYENVYRIIRHPRFASLYRAKFDTDVPKFERSNKSTTKQRIERLEAKIIELEAKLSAK